jgi:hypothetical protein
MQKVTGFVLYYARAVDPTVIIPLNDITTEQTKATEKTQAATNQLLDYLDTHPDTTIIYHASYMILHIHTDAHTFEFQMYAAAWVDCFFAVKPPPHKRTP